MEYYEREVLMRAEEDTDADGKVDKWETYDGARLASVALDTSHRGVPDRRLTYGATGTTSGMSSGDGTPARLERPLTHRSRVRGDALPCSRSRTARYQYCTV